MVRAGLAADADAELVAGPPWHGDLQPRGTPGPYVPDAHVVFGGALQRDVLADEPGGHRAPDDLSETVEVLGRKGVHRLVEATVHLTAHW